MENIIQEGKTAPISREEINSSEENWILSNILLKYSFFLIMAENFSQGFQNTGFNHLYLETYAPMFLI